MVFVPLRSIPAQQHFDGVACHFLVLPLLETLAVCPPNEAVATERILLCLPTVITSGRSGLQYLQ